MGSEKITLPNESVPANELYHIRKITWILLPLFAAVIRRPTTTVVIFVVRCRRCCCLI
nr:hypothetical protein [Tanacetum cinerariifolium]